MATKKFGLKVDGLDDLISELGVLGESIGTVARPAAMAGGNVIADGANQRAPGPNVVVEVTEADPGGAEVAIAPDDEHWYYMFFETGAVKHEIDTHVREALKFEGSEGSVFAKRIKEHPGMAAEPFLRPAADEREEYAVEAVGRVFGRKVDEVVGKTGD